MAEHWKAQDITIYRDWVDSIITEASDYLNDWETKFIESIGMRLINGHNLSQFQAEKLEEIYARLTK